MQTWLADLQQLLTHGDAVVLVTVARVEGSAPREAGTRMIVTRDAARHTIGGGHLEWKAIESARQVLREGTRVPHLRRLERFALGPSLGQCCGGAVVLAFERLDIGDLGWVTTLARRLASGTSTVRSVSFGASAEAVLLSEPEAGVERADCLLWEHAEAAPGGSTALLTETIAPREFAIELFGAGHVSTALVHVLATLPCRVRWVAEPGAPFPAPDTLPAANLRLEHSADFAQAVAQAAPHSYFIVMTQHDPHDLALAEHILRRGDAAFFGLLGSHAKRQQFEHRLAAIGIDPAQIARMHCPLGVAGITEKSPESIAIATAAQLLQALEAQTAKR
ncbi:xanthine dehydrogenase accessory protein XdhC [Paraburkholderia bonniea]|uniref:xanthine dehydrogenase accessory protein XdhC n=1 Tax=Paraburkholderia bonniea TaxID=2152891 RepID=UPI0012922AE6|nr:xanthine dehydrogenase accessory protein XdhC [Paraburkholderia bonniea]WJF90970.1 xanthine dehydrogenase accessory protein XdhC [Paraburkholderia bonniea]WJF94284.1 xanthine dehydrogenase accessory protein XdhC [Paraburkholderia bonniea]